MRCRNIQLIYIFKKRGSPPAHITKPYPYTKVHQFTSFSSPPNNLSTLHPMSNHPIAHWKDALSNYRLVITRRSRQRHREGLRHLDHFAQVELPARIRNRYPQRYITANEYQNLFNWRLRRQKWRPNLQAQANKVSPEEVVARTRSAYDLLQSGAIHNAIAVLLPMRGCGTSVAVAILAVADDTVPFLSNEIVLAFQNGKSNYRQQAVVHLIEQVRQSAMMLQKLDPATGWTSRLVERALYANAYMLAKHKTPLAHPHMSAPLPDTNKVQLNAVGSASVQHLGCEEKGCKDDAEIRNGEEEVAATMSSCGDSDEEYVVDHDVELIDDDDDDDGDEFEEVEEKEEQVDVSDVEDVVAHVANRRSRINPRRSPFQDCRSPIGIRRSSRCRRTTMRG